MNNERVTEIARKWNGAGNALNWSPDNSRLLIRVWRTLAKGRPVSGEQIDQIISDLGVNQDEAGEFLKGVTERDSGDSIVGIFGLSLNDHPHRFSVNGASLTTWCAEDALFLPAMLAQKATVESYSPLSKEKIRLTVGPETVEEVSPADAVVSIVTLDPSKVDTSSMEAIYGNFCEQIHFFASREEAERWAAERENIDILSVEEGYELGKLAFSGLLAYA